MLTPSSNGNGAPLTIRAAIDKYLAHDALRQGRCLAAALEREKTLTDFCAFGDPPMGSRLVVQCCAGDLQFWVDAHSQWKSNWTIKRNIATVQRPFNWLAGLGVLHNPFSALKHRDGERGRPISPEEFQLLLRNTDVFFRRVLIFLRYSGCRPGELRRLEWQHIRPEEECAVLTRHKTAHSRKDRAPRTIYLNPVCMKLLAYLWRHHSRAKIFLNSRGTPWTKAAINLRLWNLRKRLGIDPRCKLHGTRHAFGTTLAKAGANAPTIMELLGHTSLQMSLNYIHLAGDKTYLHDALIKGLSAK